MRNTEEYKEIQTKEKTALVGLRRTSVDWEKISNTDEYKEMQMKKITATALVGLRRRSV